jgi:hypothetical protein
LKPLAIIGDPLGVTLVLDSSELSDILLSHLGRSFRATCDPKGVTDNSQGFQPLVLCYTDTSNAAMKSHPQQFIVPLKGVNTFCTFRDGELVPENPLPVVGFDGHAIDPEFGWVAWVGAEGKTLGRIHLDATEGEGGFAPLQMPAEYQAKCLLFHRQVLFVGGRCGKEVIGSYDFASPEPKWTPLEVPEQFRQYGKRIDDLLLDGERLIAVDDIVIPKYLLRYDVADPRNPRLLDVREIPWHSTYETIHSGALGTDWLALLSSTSNHGWWGLHIALLDRETLQEHGAMTQTKKGSFRGGGPDTQRDWRQIALQGNTLLIAAGTDGVGVLGLDEIDGTQSADAGISARYRGSPEQLAFGERCLAALHYRPLPAPYTGCTVTRVVAVSGTRHYLAVVDTDAGCDTVVMELR